MLVTQSSVFCGGSLSHYPATPSSAVTYLIPVSRYFDNIFFAYTHTPETLVVSGHTDVRYRGFVLHVAASSLTTNNRPLILAGDSSFDQVT